MKIIDFHAHIYPEKIAQKAVEGVGSFYSINMDCEQGTAEYLLKQGRQAGVDRFLVQSVATTPAQVESINNFIAQECKEHSEFIGFGTLHPDMDDPIKEIERIKKLGLKGIKLHPDTQKFNIDDTKMKPVYKALGGDLPILMHCGDYRYSYSHPKRLANVLDEFKELTVIAAHFGGWSLWDLAVEYLKDRRCYLDCSSSFEFLGGVRFKELIEIYGSDRIIFGTDFPMWKAKNELEHIYSLNLPQADLKNILYKNAMRVLGEEK